MKIFFKEANSYDTSKFINIRSPDFTRCHLIIDKIDTIQVVHELVQTLHTGSKWEVRSEFRVINLKPISFRLVCIVWCIPWSQILQHRELHFRINCWHASSDMTDDQKGWTLLTKKKYIYIYIYSLAALTLSTQHISLFFKNISEINPLKLQNWF